jgi:hypothetical protein
VRHDAHLARVRRQRSVLELHRSSGRRTLLRRARGTSVGRNARSRDRERGDAPR